MKKKLSVFLAVLMLSITPVTFALSIQTVYAYESLATLSLIYPYDGQSVNVNLPFTVRWEGSNVSNYYVAIRDLTTDTENVFLVPLIQDTYCKIPANTLIAGHEYRIAVRGTKSDGSTIWAIALFQGDTVSSNVTAMRFQVPYEGQVLTANNNNQIFMEWIAGENGIYHELTVRDTTTGKIIFKSGLVENGYNISVIKGHSYRASICTVTASGEKYFSPSKNTIEFTVASDQVQRDDIVAIAKNELNYKELSGGYTKYGDWYGYPYSDWCAMFVSWCANQAGISENIVPKHASCSIGIQWFKKNAGWKDGNSSYLPQKGDIIYFKKGHVGIVDDCRDGYVYYIDGNNKNTISNDFVALKSSTISGYGIPNYK